MPQNEVTEAVRSLRQHLGDTQQQFAARLSLAISTVVRYELSRPPRGKHLAQFERLATEHRLNKEATVFRNALNLELFGPPGNSAYPQNYYPHVASTVTENESNYYPHILPSQKNEWNFYPRIAGELVPENEFEWRLVQDVLRKARHSRDVSAAIRLLTNQVAKVRRLMKKEETPDAIASALRLPLEDVKAWIVIGEARHGWASMDLSNFFEDIGKSGWRDAQLAARYRIPISAVETARKALLDLTSPRIDGLE